MALIKTDDKHYKAIANKIREHAIGDLKEMTVRPDQMTDGIDIVFLSGNITGHEVGYTEGKEAEYDRFWDNAQNGGNSGERGTDGSRRNYQHAFAGEGWTDYTFKPKYNIICGMPPANYYMFNGSKITNLKKILEDCGVTIDASVCTYFTNMFANSTITEVGVLDCSGANTVAAFGNATYLRSVDKVILRRGTSFPDGFKGCTSLEHIIFEGEISRNLNVQWSPLDRESLLNILSCLADKTTDTSGTVWEITLGEANLAKLTEEEKANAEAKGWILG